MYTIDSKKKKIIVKQFLPDPKLDLQYQPDLTILALTILYEAGGEKYEGKIAVGNTIMARFRSDTTWWGKTISGVCLRAFQFSCWNRKEREKRKMQNRAYTDIKVFTPGWDDSCMAALEAYTGYTIKQDNATHYYSTIIKEPRWAKKLTFVTQIGLHRFYK